MEEKQLKEFFDRFSRNEHTEEEHAQFINWLNTLSARDTENILKKYQQTVTGTVWLADPHLAEKIEQRINALSTSEARQITLWTPVKKYAAAACILVVSAAAFYLIKAPEKTTEQAVLKKAAVKSNIVQGRNAAILTLADGTVITLDSAKVGNLANQDNVAVFKTNDGQIAFDATRMSSQQKRSDQLNYYSLSTPRGGQYFVKLPDGTKVWLNAASSIKFLSEFSAKERLVELSGEAYFEVEKDNKRPFIVKTALQEVQVLGTSFNINSYSDEPHTTTTLLNGSIRVALPGNNAGTLLKPGQQARLANTGDNVINVATVDPQQFVDWKDGYFKFSRDSIQSIMRKIARWYDVDVVYSGNVTKEGFVGTIKRSEDISEVLQTLKLTGIINFKIEGKTITVLP
jgi:ferric-dicitrate binding protein FerR (iron transport regulator)